ncbi:uncharacterized protein LOC144095537 [Amblyomma americanum]
MAAPGIDRQGRMQSDRADLQVVQVFTEGTAATSFQQRATLAGIKPPQPFYFHNAADWPSWIEEFEDYSFASGLSEKKEEIQVRTLLYTMGRKAREILRSLAVKDEDLKTFKVVKAKFEAYFVHTKKTVYESARFNRRRQQPGETVDEFATNLHKLAARCDFDNMKNRLIRDRFVVGLLDEALSEELQMDPKLTLATALARTRTNETIKQQQADLKQREGTSAETYVAAVKNKKTEQKREWNATLTRRKKTASVKNCTYCAGSMHPRSSCPAKQQKWFYCQKLGHFEKACRIKNRERKLDGVTVPGCPDNDCPDNEHQFLGTITPRQSKLSAHFVTVQINCHEVKMKVDTRAEVTVVGENFPGMPSYLEKAANLRGPSDAGIDTCGKFQAEIAWKDNRCEQTVYDVRPHSKTGLSPRCGDKHETKDVPSCMPTCIFCGGQHLADTGSCRERNPTAKPRSPPPQKIMALSKKDFPSFRTTLPSTST